MVNRLILWSLTCSTDVLWHLCMDVSVFICPLPLQMNETFSPSKPNQIQTHQQFIKQIRYVTRTINQAIG